MAKFWQRRHIFVSYRRSDTLHTANRLAVELQRAFGASRVFLDTDTLEAGDEFTSRIGRSLHRADAVVVLIGPRWEGRNEDGTTRIDSEQDWVRKEVSIALALNAPTFPLLVDRDAQPDVVTLPADVQPLFARHWGRLRTPNNDWRNDVKDLEKTLAKVPALRPTPWAIIWLVALCAIAIGLLAGIGTTRIVFQPAAMLIGNDINHSFRITSFDETRATHADRRAMRMAISEFDTCMSHPGRGLDRCVDPINDMKSTCKRFAVDNNRATATYK
jgi:hypothetical protein